MKFGPTTFQCVLQGQVKVVVGAELLLQQAGDLAGILVRHSWNRESCHAFSLPFSCLPTHLPACGSTYTLESVRGSNRYAHHMTESAGGLLASRSRPRLLRRSGDRQHQVVLGGAQGRLPDVREGADHRTGRRAGTGVRHRIVFRPFRDVRVRQGQDMCIIENRCNQNTASAPITFAS